MHQNLLVMFQCLLEPWPQLYGMANCLSTVIRQDRWVDDPSTCWNRGRNCGPWRNTGGFIPFLFAQENSDAP